MKSVQLRSRRGIRTISTISSFSLLLALGSASLQADELLLSTGETLVGVLEGSDADFYYFRSPTFGLVKVARKDATYTDNANDSVARAVELTKISSVPAGLQLDTGPDGAAQRTVQKPLPIAVAEETEDEAITDTEPSPEDRLWLYTLLDYLNPLKKWNSRLELSYAWRSAQTKSVDWRTTFTSARDWNSAKLRYFATYAYGTVRAEGEEREKTTDEFETKLSFEQKWTDRFSWSVSGSYKFDQVLDIEHQSDALLAVQWSLWKSPRLEFYLKPKAGGRYRQTGEESGEWFFITEMEQGLKFQWTPRTKLYEIGQFQWASETFERSAYTLILGMENKLTDVLGLHLRYKNSFDYLVDMGIDRGRQEVTASLFYDF